MTYSIYTMFGYYETGRFLVGGFKTLNNAKERCVEILAHLWRQPGKLEIIDTKTKKAVGWMYNSYRGEMGYWFEDKDGNFKLYRRW